MCILGCTRARTRGCTWVAPKVALVGAVIIHNGSSNVGTDAVLEGALDGGLNVGFEWVS